MTRIADLILALAEITLAIPDLAAHGFATADATHLRDAMVREIAGRIATEGATLDPILADLIEMQTATLAGAGDAEAEGRTGLLTEELEALDLAVTLARETFLARAA